MLIFISPEERILKPDNTSSNVVFPLPLSPNIAILLSESIEKSEISNPQFLLLSYIYLPELIVIILLLSVSFVFF